MISPHLDGDRKSEPRVSLPRAEKVEGSKATRRSFFPSAQSVRSTVGDFSICIFTAARFISACSLHDLQPSQEMKTCPL